MPMIRHHNPAQGPSIAPCPRLMAHARCGNGGIVGSEDALALMSGNCQEISLSADRAAATAKRFVSGSCVHRRMVRVVAVFAVSAVERRECRKTLTLRRSGEHTSALQSLMRTSYAVSCLKKQ